jgi:hypothetical protein
MGKTSKKQTRSERNRADPDAAKQRAIEYCLFHYPTLYTAGVPKRSAQSAMNVWVIPIVLEDPEAGISERVGELRIDAETKEVVASTPAAEVIAAGKRLYEESRHARPAAAVSPTKIG